MSFYLKPPRGLTNIINLENVVRQRIICYVNISNADIANIIVNLECLVEDSVLDRLGHYIFRLLALENIRIRKTFIDNETSLLDIRLNNYSIQDVRCFIKNLKRHLLCCLEAIEVNGEASCFYTALNKVLSQLSYCLSKHKDKDFNKLQIAVPFQYCYTLLATREFNIKNGKVTINCVNWKLILLSLYQTYLNLALKEMKFMKKVHDAIEDERIASVLVLAKNLYFKNVSGTRGGERGTITMNNFNEEALSFPLCMKNLYANLVQSNRLGHHARLEFGLYLKDIGLSVEDALKFWENFYSKPHSACSSCTHSWKDNEKRYMYGIRHLYGLEGSRKDYNAKCCTQIQEKTLRAHEEGGCPFQHFDDDNLRLLLQNNFSITAKGYVEVIIHTRKSNPKNACKLFFTQYLEENFKKEISSEKLTLYNPADYYFLLKKML